MDNNRSNQLPIDNGVYRGMELVDIDTTIYNHIKNSIIPKLYQNGNEIELPVIYGNAERWADVRLNGYIRDEKGVIQVPLIVFKRGSVEQNDSIPYFKDGTVMPAIVKYSNKNKYERFNVQNDIKPIYDLYNISVPNYVTITYDIVIWTSFTEHMNKILEQFQYASSRYWGDKKGYKFFTKVDTLDGVQEINDSEARIIKTEFSITVNGFILPTEFKNKLTISKELSSKKIIYTNEVQSESDQFILNKIKAGIPKNKNILGNYKSSNTVSITDGSQIINGSKYKLYINNIPVPVSDVTYSYNDLTGEILFNINNKTILESDTVFITGQFV